MTIGEFRELTAELDDETNVLIEVYDADNCRSGYKSTAAITVETNFKYDLLTVSLRPAD